MKLFKKIKDIFFLIWAYFFRFTWIKLWSDIESEFGQTFRLVINDRVLNGFSLKWYFSGLIYYFVLKGALYFQPTRTTRIILNNNNNEFNTRIKYDTLLQAAPSTYDRN